MLRADQVDGVLRRGGSARLADEVPPRFAPGQQVRARNIHPQGHTRLPRYLRGRVGTVHRDQGVFILPDAHARGEKTPARLYCVRFESETLWGEDAAARAPVYADLFECYLDEAR